MDFCYEREFNVPAPVAYETLLLDAIRETPLCSRVTMKSSRMAAGYPHSGRVGKQCHRIAILSGGNRRSVGSRRFAPAQGPYLATAGEQVPQFVLEPNKHMTTLVVSDLDGTLLTPEKQITVLSREAIADVLAAGIRFTAISSRPPRGMQWIVEELKSL